ncbi:MAG: hypothetical protein KUG77_12000 [Nannocystaceae bacterium]|nr:hypothetical protein [Nannocystaceae bacterium]
MPKRRRPVALQGHIHQPRALAVAAIVECLGKTSAIIDDVVEYSNTMSTYRLELDANDLSGLETLLRDAGISLEARDPAGPLDTDDEGYVLVTLAVVFPGEDDNRKVPNPDLG